ncbi:MAG: L-serine ammonia-lyase, iron-sulfur-dependent, subunit alpha [Bacteroidales bacterium]|jgi:L-cysteine desulfidase|nr:L-serine ammonia-lyase, iron-sulfur-dependent, subunit alpha [Bacteroidales bacterium]MDD4702986.1 L-serine ammonia-lyase, iron-sulfur-dependent, subunit alpha [Bacteroidales bacterium]MDX9799179.1 L-serine ammonia-lyase, iron-sulfur-dependent, subunit alpha [Bacteroidales bacterium]
MPKKEIIKQLLKENIILATGCTEPVAVALCVAKAKETLGKEPQRIELHLSPNIIKNAMGVGIPGTNMKGLPIAVAIGVVGGNSANGLDVLNDAGKHLEKAKQWLKNNRLEIIHAKDVDKLYIECRAYSDEEYSRAVISKTHNNFTHVEKSGEVIFHKEEKTDIQANTNENVRITSKDVFDYATLTELSELEWVMDIAKVIKATSEEGLKGDYGLRIGKLMFSNDDLTSKEKVIAMTCAASDARMDGVSLPVYSNSGSGNQGITCTMPVYEFGMQKNKSNEEIIRALILSHLMSIYIKQYIGRLSALCGIVNASIGVSSALVYLQGGTYEQVCYSIKNMINTLTGMICDGAKPSCALKISAGLNAAFDSSALAIRNIVVDETDGISERDIERSIKNLGKIGRYGMDEIDQMILEIMTHKEN